MSSLAPKPVDGPQKIVQGVWGAKLVWGSSSRSDGETTKLNEGDEECYICFEAAIDVNFVPCKHGACTTCVGQLRAAAIFSPDAGVKCPYCRQFVTGFSSLTGEFSQLPNLREANKAAKAAAAARETSSQQKLQAVRQPAAQQQHAGPPQTWQCADCSKINYGFSAKCHRCKKPAPPAALPVKEVLQCDHEELLHAACRKFHPDFNAAFKEAGLPFNTDEARLGGTNETVVAAMRTGGPKRLLHIVAVLSGHNKIGQMATDVIGNYTLQDLLHATKMLRQAALDPATQALRPDDGSSTIIKDAYEAFARLQRPVLDKGTELVKHPQGFYVLEKTVYMSSGPELLELAAAIFAKHPDVLLNTKHLRFISRVIDRLSDTALSGKAADAERAGVALDSFCRSCSSNVNQLVHSACYFKQGQMLVEAVQGALPRTHSVQMAGLVAAHALKLAGSKMGVSTLQSLMSLRSSDDNSKEQIITVICCVAESLEGSVCDVMIRYDLDGHRLIQTLVEQLVAAREHLWVFSIASELVQGARSYGSRPQARSVLAFTLAQPSFEDHQLAQLLKELQDRTGNANFIVASANEIRSKQHPKLPEILPLAPASGHMSVEHVASNGHPPITPAPDVHPPPALTPSRSKSTAAAVSIPAHKATSANHESALASQSDALPETSSDPLANGHASPAEAAAVPLLFGNGLPPSFAVMPPPAPYVPNAQGPLHEPLSRTSSAASRSTQSGPTHPDPSHFFPSPLPASAPAPPAARQLQSTNVADFLPHMLGNFNMESTPATSAAAPHLASPSRSITAEPGTRRVEKISAAVSPSTSRGLIGLQGWACGFCTYEHSGSEAAFLACAMCGQPRNAQDNATH